MVKKKEQPADHGPLCEIGRQMAAGKSESEAWAAFHERERKCIERDGWFAHLIHGDPTTPTGVNYHTHGLAECHGHTDLQLIVALPPATTNSIFWNIINRIKAGEKFKDGDVVSEIIGKYDVKFVAATENDRPVLRIILPDADGNLDRGTIKGGLDSQYDDL